MKAEISSSFGATDQPIPQAPNGRFCWTQEALSIDFHHVLPSQGR